MRVWSLALSATQLNEGFSLCGIIKIITAVIDYLYVNAGLQPQLCTQWDKNLQAQNKKAKNSFKSI